MEYYLSVVPLYRIRVVRSLSKGHDPSSFAGDSMECLSSIWRCLEWSEGACHLYCDPLVSAPGEISKIERFY